MPAALATLFCTDADVQALLSALGVTLRLDDDGDGALSVSEAAFLAQAESWATSQVRMYTSGIYDADKLAQSWLANEWATVLACWYVSCRRANPAPDSIRELAFGADGRGGVMQDLRDVRDGKLQVPDVGARNPSAPAWSNVRIDPFYRLRQIRVQRPISEKTPTKTYGQTPDYAAEDYYEF